MANLLIAFKYAILFLACALGGMVGCKSGLDSQALPLDTNDVINYGKQVANDNAAIEAVVYGQLMPGSNDERKKQILDGDLRQIRQITDRIRRLKEKYAFDSTEADFISWIEIVEQKNSSLATDVDRAINNATAARNLAVTIELDVKTGGRLTTTFTDGEKLVPSDGKNEFGILTEDLASRFDHLYQTVIMLALANAQKDAVEELGKIEFASGELKANLIKRTIIDREEQVDLARSTVQQVLNRAHDARMFIDGMTAEYKVANDFSDAATNLQNAINKLTSDYVDVANANEKIGASNLVNTAIAAAKALNKIALDFSTGIESLKNKGTDAKLATLVEDAFSSGIPLLHGDVSIEDKTNVNELLERFSDAPIVILKEDGSSHLLVVALASSVVYKIAPIFKIENIDNIIGLNHSSLVKRAQKFNLSPKEMEVFATSRAKMVREERGKENNYRNIHVLYADELASEGADISAMIDELSVADGKVLVITAEPSTYANKGEVFLPHGLDMPSVILSGNAVLRQVPHLKVPLHKISETVARLVVGMGNFITLADIKPLMKDAANRVSKLKHSASEEIISDVMAILLEKKISVVGADRSGLLLHSLTVIQNNLAKNPNYYVEAAGK